MYIYVDFLGSSARKLLVFDPLALQPAPGSTQASSASKIVDHIATVGYDDHIASGLGPELPDAFQHSLGRCHAPVVILDVGKGMKGAGRSVRFWD